MGKLKSGGEEICGWGLREGREAERTSGEEGHEEGGWIVA